MLAEFEGEAIHGNLKEAIQRTTAEKDGKEEIMHQCKRHHGCAFDWVDWDSVEPAVQKLKKQDHHRWLRITKMMNDLLHANNVWAERRKGEDSKCADCGETENQRHMFVCKQGGRTEHREDARELLQGMLKKQGTAGELSNVPTGCIKRWEKHPDDHIVPEEVPVKANGEMKPFRWNDAFSEQMHLAAQNQNDTGWENLLKGRISKHWVQAQEMHFWHMKAGEKNNGKIWGVQLITTLWMHSELIWLH